MSKKTIIPHNSTDMAPFPDSITNIPLPEDITVWKLLVVDDEDDVHNVTRLVFSGFELFGRRLLMLSAHSAAEAKRILSKHTDIAVIMLDVVMESDDAGLMLVKYIREDLQDLNTQIILRTGYPGNAPEYDAIRMYEINDYREKRELTAKRLLTCVTTAIRSYIRAVSLSEALEHQKELAGKLIDIQELERASIARELHDEIGQMLTAISVGLEVALRKADKATKDLLIVQKKQLNELAGKVREMLLDLRPSMLSESGIVEAVDRHIRRTLPGTGIKASFIHRNVKGIRFNSTVELVVFRVIQEGITNIIRHSDSTSVDIRLMLESGYISLRIRDYGVGFDRIAVSRRSDRLGLPGMEERAQAVGGVLKLISKPGKGTLISLCLHINTEE
jgi:signal transduction histidine kinase